MIVRYSNGTAWLPINTLQAEEIIIGNTAPSNTTKLWVDTSTQGLIPAEYSVANNCSTSASGIAVLDAYQGKVLQEQINQLSTDYIVEQGTSGIWTYEKWNSGKAVCWGTTGNITLSNYSTSNGFYGYKTDIVYPTDLFIEAPVTTWSAVIGNGFAMCGTLTSTHTATESTIYCLASASGSQTTRWYIRAIGRWK